MLVVQWWRSFACPGSRAEGKRYHDWDGCIERIIQLDSWPDVRTGSSTELLATSIFGPLPPRADYTCPSHAARNGSIPVNCARASSASPSRLLDHLGGAQQNRWGYRKPERLG